MGAKGTGLRPQRPDREDRAEPQAAARPRPAGHQPQADGPRQLQAGRNHQRARRRVAAVREPQLVLPRRRRARTARSTSRCRTATTSPRTRCGSGRRSRCTAAIEDGCPAPVFANHETHWWDGSQIYGSRHGEAEDAPHLHRRQDQGRRRRPAARERRPRRRPHRDAWRTGGSARRCCTRCSPASTTRSCDELKKAYPDLDDQRLFELGVLVVSALIAKIHTVEWTTCVLRHPALQIGMNANWYGALGRDVQGQDRPRRRQRGVLAASSARRPTTTLRRSR